MNIEDLLKDSNKVKEILGEAIDKKNKELAEILIPIVKDPELTYMYAEKITKRKIKKEWEDIIIQDPYYSYLYSLRILDKPFPKGEETIAKNGFYSFQYASNVLIDRFILGEEAIIKDKYYYLEDYIKFLKRIGKSEEFYRDYPKLKRSTEEEVKL